MKNVRGWMLPDHEAHLNVWMEHPKNQFHLHGRQAYQGKKQSAAIKNCKSFRTALDVGGHVGFWSFNLAAWFKTVHAFEPIEEHRKCFVENVVDSNVVLHACALGVTNGMINMATEQGSSGNSTVSGSGNIPMVLLDSFNFEDVDFIKVDVEGFEENVLRGGARTIEKWQPTIIVEQKRDMSTRFGLSKLGAVGYLQKQFGYKVVEEISGDFIMVRGMAS